MDGYSPKAVATKNAAFGSPLLYLGRPAKQPESAAGVLRTCRAPPGKIFNAEAAEKAETAEKKGERSFLRKNFSLRPLRFLCALCVKVFRCRVVVRFSLACIAPAAYVKSLPRGKPPESAASAPKPARSIGRSRNQGRGNKVPPEPSGSIKKAVVGCPEPTVESGRRWGRLVVPTVLLAAILLIAFLYLAFCDPGNNKFINLFQLRLFGSVHKNFGASYTGEVRSWWPNGQLSTLETYKKGILHGRYGRWEPDGVVRADGVYLDGRPWEGTFQLAEVVPGSQTSYLIVVSFEQGIPVHASTYDGKPFSGTIREPCYSEITHEFRDGVPVMRKQ